MLNHKLYYFILLVLICVFSQCKAAEIAPPKNSAEVYYQLGKEAYKEKDYTLATEHYLIALEMFIDNTNKEGQAKTYNKLGIIFFSTYFYENAIMFYSKAARLYLELSNLEKLGECSFNIGKCLYRMEKYDTANTYYHEAKKLFNNTKSNEKVLATEHQIAVLYLKEMRYDSAEILFIKVINSNDQSRVARAMNDIGYIYQQRGEIDIARDWYKRAIEGSSSYVKTIASNNLAQLAEEEENQDLAKKHYLEATGLMKSKDFDNPALFNTYIKLRDLYENENNIDSAYWSSKMVDSMAMKINKTQQELRQMVNRYQGMIVLKMWEQKAHEKKQAKIRYSLFAVSGGLVVGLVFLFVHFRNRKNKLLAELAQTATELRASAMKVVTSEAFYERAENMLLEMEQDNVSKYEKVEAIVKSQLRNKTAWDMYFKHYDNIFFKCLPELGVTKSEQKVIVMMAMGMSPEKIASTLGISLHLLSVYRNHIKNKLGLKKEDDLYKLIIEQMGDIK